LRQTQQGIHGVPITLSWYEQHDKDTITQLCVTCGGKGFYLLIHGVPGINEPKGKLTICEDCEDGFKYSKSLVEDHGEG